jgi:predicted MFS family arabinose efflux permease
VAGTPPETATFGSVFRVGEFRALWLAQILSVAGDQLARVALTILVYNRTDSAALSALTYALTFLPDLAGGPLLSGLADRFPRRDLMVVADLARVLLVALMAWPGMPLVPLCGLLVVVQLLASPFNAARGAVLPTLLTGDEYVTGNAVMNITYQTGQLAGYVVGGALVAFTGTSVALLIDAATFLASALLVRFGLLHRPVPAPEHTDAEAKPEGPGYWGSLAAGMRLVWSNLGLRALVGLACLSAFYVTAEGLSVPYAHELGGGAVTAGLLFAANPAGVSIGATLLTRLIPPTTRLRLLGPMAVACCAVLVICAARPNLVVTLVVWLVCGAFGAYQTVASAAFVRAVPDSARGQAFGLALTSMRVVQGLGIALAGGLAQWLSPSLVVAVFGGVGTVVALILAATWTRSQGLLAPANATAQA